MGAGTGGIEVKGGLLTGSFGTAGTIPIILPVGALPEAIELVPFEDPEEGMIDAIAVVLDGDAPPVMEAVGRPGRLDGVLRGEELAGLFGMAGTMPT
jgi:hypothetical protein